MKTALIGYSGFVGGNIAQQAKFDDYYDHKNIAQIGGKEYDLVVSAANRAEMWRINQEGDKDLAEIKEYINHISKANIKKLVLVSSVGVYEKAIGVDEDTPINSSKLLPYGANRYYLEQVCSKSYNTTIVRLPGLFGNGLKKNVIFDLLNNNNVDKIHADGVYQYYNLSNIWHDMQVAINNNLALVNFATEPVSTKEVAEYAFDLLFDNSPKSIKPAMWDMKSKYAKYFGGKNGYLYSKKQELNDIKEFVEKNKKV